MVVENLIDDARRENAFGLMMSLNMLIEFGEAFDFTGADFTGWCRRRASAVRDHPPGGTGQRGSGVQVTMLTGEATKRAIASIREYLSKELVSAGTYRSWRVARLARSPLQVQAFTSPSGRRGFGSQ